MPSPLRDLISSLPLQAGLVNADTYTAAKILFECQTQATLGTAPELTTRSRRDGFAGKSIATHAGVQRPRTHVKKLSMVV